MSDCQGDDTVIYFVEIGKINNNISNPKFLKHRNKNDVNFQTWRCILLSPCYIVLGVVLGKIGKAALIYMQFLICRPALEFSHLIFFNIWCEADVERTRANTQHRRGTCRAEVGQRTRRNGIFRRLHPLGQGQRKTMYMNINQQRKLYCCRVQSRDMKQFTVQCTPSFYFAVFPTFL